VDHIAGIPRLLELTDAKVRFHASVRGHIERGEKLVFPPLRRWPNMFINNIDIPEPRIQWQDLRTMTWMGLPFLNKSLPFRPEHYYREGDDLPGENGFTLLETPGHTECSVCFFNEETGDLISGDTLLGGKRGPEPNTFVRDRDLVAQSARRLKELPIKTLYPGHGLILEGEGLLEDMDEMPIPDGLHGLRARLRKRPGKRRSNSPRPIDENLVDHHTTQEYSGDVRVRAATVPS
jgi:glyoxylase-like metal-dependent hydrolase (beta-lactamase superfamily II)